MRGVALGDERVVATPEAPGDPDVPQRPETDPDLRLACGEETGSTSMRGTPAPLP